MTSIAGSIVGIARHRTGGINVSSVYATPNFSNGTLGAILGRWQISGILRISSGSPLEVSSGADTALTGITAGRADQLLPDVYHKNKNVDHWFNPAAFARPATGT
jgi:hypothetical protein